METSLQYSSLEFQNSLENYYYTDKDTSVWQHPERSTKKVKDSKFLSDVKETEGFLPQTGNCLVRKG